MKTIVYKVEKVVTTTTLMWVPETTTPAELIHMADHPDVYEYNDDTHQGVDGVEVLTDIAVRQMGEN